MPAAVDDVLEIVRADVAVPPAVSETLKDPKEVVSPPGEVEVVCATVPAKLLRLPRLMMVAPDEPATKLSPGGVAMLKSTTLTVTITGWERAPLIPVTVTVYVPALEAVHDSVEVKEVPKLALVGLREHARPVPGETSSESETVPTNPFRLFTVMVDVIVEPALTGPMVLGLEETEKSGLAPDSLQAVRGCNSQPEYE